MKILLLGDASNYHNALAKGLRALGHDVTVASDGSGWMNTERDIDLTREKGRLGGLKLWLKLNTSLASSLKGYDVVQLVSPGFVHLRPSRLRKLFKKLKKNNKAVFLTALGTDSAYVRDCTSPEPALAFSEWHNKDGLRSWANKPVAEKDKWLAPGLAAYTDELYRNVDGVVSALYEYHKVVEHQFPDVALAYGGIPIDLDSIPESSKRDFNEKIPMLIAAHRGREAEKGIDVLLRLMQMAEAHSKGRIGLVRPKRNVPYADFLKTLADSGMVCDQLYAHTPATTALLAMAMGVIPVTGGSQEYYDFIGEKELRPIFNTHPDDRRDLYVRFMDLINNPEELARMSAEGRRFVAKHNDAKIVAQRFVDFWNSKVKTENK